MSFKIRLRTIVLTFAVILLMLSTNALAIAQVSDQDSKVPVTSNREWTPAGEERDTVTGGPGYLMLSAYDFQPLYMDTDWAFFNGRELYNPGVEPGYYFAPVHLPNGATVNKVVLYYYDDVVQNLSLTLMRLFAEGLTGTDMAYLGSTGTGGYDYYFESSITEAVIDLANYSYVLHLTIPTGASYDLTLLHVRIDYDYPAFLPTVLK